MPFSYKHVLLIGATSGIGKGLADRFIAEGIKVTAVGRRKGRLDEFVPTHGSEKASSIVFDIRNLPAIPMFAQNAVGNYPTIDAIFLNAGVQRQYNFAKPESVDISTFNTEITTNFTSFVALTHAFLPYLLKKGNTHLISFAMPTYSTSKAALDSFILSIREQLCGTKIKVINLSPPVVQTELHDHEMGEERGRSFGQPLNEFVDEAWAGLNGEEQDIYIGTLGGSSKEQFLEVAQKRKEAFDRMSTLLRGLIGGGH